MRICVICGKEYEPHHYKQKTCCAECGDELHKRTQRAYTKEYQKTYKRKKPEPKQRFCKICGKPVDPALKHFKYCSDECAKIGFREAVKKSYKKNHNGDEYRSEKHRVSLVKELADIRKKSTLDKDIQTLKQDGAKLGLKSYDYGKYAHAKGL